MAIVLDEATEQLLQRELDRGRFTDANDLITHAIRLVQAEPAAILSESQMEDWLIRNREGIRAGIEESYDAEARGEWYSPEESQALLEKHRAQRRASIT